MTTTLEAPAATAGDVYREALEQVCSAQRSFAAFLQARAALHYRNASAYEAKTGRLANKDRATAAEVEYLNRRTGQRYETH